MANVIVVVGAGVSGLTSALLLSKNPSNAITIVAKDMPGDYAASYASPWAGALFVPQDGSRPSQLECRTWPVLKDLATTVPEAGIHFQKLKLQRRNRMNEDANSGFSGTFVQDPWFRTLFDDFSELDQGELADGYDAGYAFTTVCINTMIYLPWLVGQCVKRGVVLKRASLSHINQAQHLSHTKKAAEFIINCTGLGSLNLGGVNDGSMAPARGQVVVVRNHAPSMLMFSSTDDGPGEKTYIMERAVGGGTVLGGTYEVGNWDPTPDLNTSVRIMKRVVDTCPELAEGKGIKGLSVIRHGVGFRPFRQEGVRLEKQRLDDGTWILHNYGHDSWGYLGSYGCAERVVELFEEAINSDGNQKSNTKSITSIKPRL